jgi:DNA repair protein RadC
LDAPYDELAKVSGIGENAALLINLLLQIFRRYQMCKAHAGTIVSSTSQAGTYLLPCYLGEKGEAVYMVCLDSKCKAIATVLLCRGSINSAAISTRKVVETALSYNAAGVILSHNHTSGVALPSNEDIETTRRIASALKAVEIDLVDHIIIADEDFISLSDCGDEGSNLPYLKG